MIVEHPTRCPDRPLSMTWEPTTTYELLLVPVGLVAGFVNTLAGGGSLLTLPALMLVGLPAPIANGTNRVAILVQCATSTHAFHRRQLLDMKHTLVLMPVALIGATSGAWIASQLSSQILTWVVLVTLVLVGILFVWSPQVSKAQDATRPPGLRAQLLLGAACFYGGFIQAGAGLLMLFALSHTCGNDLLRANASKSALMMAYTAIALVVFAGAGQVAWQAGIILAGANALGALVAVRVSVNWSQATIRRFIFAAVGASCLLIWIR